jgi:phage tail-like protein
MYVGSASADPGAAPVGRAAATHARGDRILRVDRCDGTTAGVPCIGGLGRRETALRDPHGLLVHEGWGQLLVADGRSGRVLRFELTTSQLLGTWDADDGLVEPWSLASDGRGGVLVADVGARAVIAFDAFGRRVAGPWAEMTAASPIPSRPAGLATAGSGDDAVIHLLDLDVPRVLSFDVDGRRRRSFGRTVLRRPIAIAATADAVFVGDDELRRVVVFRPSGEWVGELEGYRGPVAGLVVGADGTLLVHPGVPYAPLACAPDGAWSRTGWAWGGPFSNPGALARAWHLVTAIADVPPGAHLQLHAYATSPGRPDPDTAAAPPWAPGSTDLAATFADDALADDRWIAFPIDATAAVVHALKRPPDDGLPASGASAAATRLSRLWLGITLTSDGSTTPVVDQIRIDFDVETGLGHLPAIYSEQAASSRFLARYLALAETGFSDVERRIDALPARFDPAVAPAEALPPLAGWLGLDVDGEWSEAELRLAIAEAFGAYGRRGTVAGLREAVRRYARADVHVQEPLRNAGWWVLGEEADPTDGAASDSGAGDNVGIPLLGFTTMLAAVEPQGAVLDTTAIVDGSQLLPADEFDTGLFSNLADRFSALVYRGARYSPDRLAEIRAVIDREKPAGTVFDLCVVEPALRVGFQARVGIDAVVAGASPPTGLGEPTADGLVLGGDVPLGIGAGMEVGRSTRLMDGS